MEDYCYPVYFQCLELDEEQRRRIRNYFKIRRKSGGGECGCVMKTGDKSYSVAFKEREAQQRVLEKSEHVLDFANGPLVVIVRTNPEPHSPVSTVSPNQSVTPKLDAAASSQPIPTTSLTPTGEEYELHPDAFLIRYLSEFPTAWSELQSELTSVSCSAQIYPEEGRVVVRRSAQPADADKVRDWKLGIDNLFDSYLCHYEVDPHKVKALLQCCSSYQNTGEVGVYSEAGMAVVVGKCSQVNVTLKNLEVSTIKAQESVLSEKQISICRLGEGKLRLLQEEIKQRLEQDFPGVKASQGDSGQLILEGSMKEVVLVIELVSDMERFVSETTVPDMSPLVLAFLKKAYGGPGMLREFLGLSDDVEIELRDTELRFLSISPEKVEDAKVKTQGKFKEVKLDVPNCSPLLSELREKLKSKTNEMNQGQWRVQAVFVSDITVCLLGHSKEVEELREVVSQLILDHSEIKHQVILPFPELSQTLPELLQLHNFDHSGVVFHYLTSSSRPMMVLEGPAVKVAEIKKWLVPFLDSLFQTRVTIDLPGAARYLESSSGYENLLSLSQCQKCLLHLQKVPRENGSSTVASYSLCDGLQVQVCQGDITKLEADALVNAANEDLDHCGGVAAALSKAGGPEVQKESKALVRQTGKIRTGDVVVTTGGNLKCKKLLHAVGPKAGKAGGREKFLLKKTVTSALQLAELMEFRSIAIPCISSGIFGVPLAVCSEAIVTAVEEFGGQGGRSLSTILLIDNREEVVRALHDACERILQGTSGRSRMPSGVGVQAGAAAQNTERGATAGAAQDGVHVEVLQGTIETQQVDVLVSPIVGHDPLSTNVAKALFNLAGPKLTANFYAEAGGATQPGDTVLVQDLPGLKCKAVIFLNLAVWGNNQHGGAVQVLKRGVGEILTSCETRGFTSVAFPVLGTGAMLCFPHSVVSRVVLEEIRAFEQKRTKSSPFLVRIVIHPNDRESSKAFQSAQETLHLRGFTNDTDPDQASFYRHVSIRNDEVIAMLGGVRLQLVYGDIINEDSDAIVNTTDFSKTHVGVSKAILTAAGSTVQAELAQAGVPRDNMCTTGAGSLQCREIIHARFRRDPNVFQNNCKNILTHCESKGYSSVSFPAINTGAAGMDPAKACKAMLDGLSAAIRDLKPNSLSLIRIVIQQQPIFQAFKSELDNRFGLMATRRPSLRDKAKQKLKKLQEKCSQTPRASVPEEKQPFSSKPHPAVINVTCRGRDTVNIIKRDLEDIVQKQLIERVLDVNDISKLDVMEYEAVLAKVNVLGISLEQMFKSEIGTGARNPAGAQSGLEEEVVLLKGLKDDVWSVTELVNESLKRAQQEKEEAMLALTVQWSIQDVDGVWRELSLHHNYMLENAYLKQSVFADVMAPNGTMVAVNLTAREATDRRTGLTYKMKREETDAGLELPRQWEPMQQEVFKKVALQPDSDEYKAVAQGFLNTANNYSIQKIERVQNLYLWRAYSLCRERIFTKNGPEDVGEMHLYHGTKAESCECIERNRFDRSYAGTNAAFYGKGVYFAVHANYSADKFSTPDPLGLKRLYVACVLTGRYTVGNSAMKAPPPRGTDPTDCFDSLVDHQQQPTMFVIFHDDQAYPEYLITFK
ncbi:protein mono-ADP-ribosyltransferase PARP14-like isoform X2 [Betta splendens]|uniref:Poly [ADP-ribose] polymerase n=1 Tax=Betta splendens TaxID=158456 RepID=A0A6P7LB69_BETSP|nr:protein mono-ADP-ribosyltransferase PARP14-like isoform X2 [Betta splendens]